MNGKCKALHYVAVVRGGVTMDTYQPAAYLEAVADRPRRVRVAQLRTGSHWLREETGRWQGLAREQRVCPHCERAAVEDAGHLVFKCPRYDGCRQQFEDLFAGGSDVLSAFLSQDPVRVAQFVYECHRLTA